MKLTVPNIKKCWMLAKKKIFLSPTLIWSQYQLSSVSCILSGKNLSFDSKYLLWDANIQHELNSQTENENIVESRNFDFHWSNSEFWSQKRPQSGNIHSTKLDVYDVKQSALNLSFILSEHKQGRKYYATASSPLTTCQNWYNTCT